MMGRALLVVGWLATAGVIATAVLGYVGSGDPGLNQKHVLLALASVLLLLFSHCWIMFYLIGTGKAIKEAVKEHGLDAAAVEETKRFKNESYPALMLAMGLAMATFILGGGAATGALPPLVHHVLFWATLVAQGRALWREQRVLDANERLMAQLDRELAARPVAS
jgi:4-hydroxybenzoate polyprenyltransferase